MNINQQHSVADIEENSTSTIRGASLRRVRRTLWRLSRDQRGANFLEYAVLCGCVAIAGITAVGAYGEKVSGKFGKFGDLGTAVSNITSAPKAATGAAAPATPTK